MFRNISWQEYWTLLALLTLAYYLFIYLVYFRENIRMIFHEERSATTPTILQKENEQPSLFDEKGANVTLSAEEENEHIVYACIDELNAFFENQKKSKAIKSELMYALYSILQKYPSLSNSEYKDSITNVIATQCENICSIHLSAEEMKCVWFG